MKTRAWIVAAALGAAVAGAVALVASGGAASREEDLMKADRAFCEATAARGLEGWLSWFAQDATIYPEGRPAVTGLASIRAYYKEAGFDPKGLTWKPTQAGISESGDFGFTSGTWEMKAAGRGKAATAAGKYLTVWQRQRNGRVLVLADMGTTDPAQKAPGT